MMCSRPLFALLLSILLLFVFLSNTSLAQQSDPGDGNLNTRFCDNYPREKNRIDNKLRAFKKLAKFNVETQRTCLRFAKTFENLCSAREHLIALGIQLCQFYPAQSDPLNNCNISDDICGPIEVEETLD